MKYSDSLVKKIEKTLTGILGFQLRLCDEMKPWVTAKSGITEKKTVAPHAYLALPWLDQARTIAEPDQVNLLPLYSHPSGPKIWFGLRMRFRHVVRARPAEYQFEAASIYFARGDQDPRIMIRAEWDCRPSADFRHAQPHWHLHTGIEAGNDQVDPVDSYWAAVLMHLHLAMAATWGHDAQVGRQSSHWTALNHEDHFVEWVRHCTIYLRDQIIYATGKANYPFELAPVETAEYSELPKF